MAAIGAINAFVARAESSAASSTAKISIPITHGRKLDNSPHTVRCGAATRNTCPFFSSFV